MQQKNKEQKDNIPKSSLSRNTYKDFNKICRAYYDELMHLSKSDSPSLSKNDILILNDLINEIVTYTNELIKLNFIQEAKKILDIGLVISDFLLKVFGEMFESQNTNKNNLVEKLKFPLSLKLLLLEANFNIIYKYEKDYINCEKNLSEIIEIQLYLQSSNENISSSKFYMGIIKYHLNKYDEALKYVLEAKNLLENLGTENSGNKGIDENMKVEKISNILNFLAELYRMGNDNKNAISCYENGYYLNLGRIGGKKLNKDYFKKKLDELNEEIKGQ